MASFETLRFDNRYARLHPSLFEVVDPTPLSNPRLVAFNRDAAALIDLDSIAVDDPLAASYLSGAKRLPGAEPLAMLYAGHQFGVWVPQLGDGRAILLGQVTNLRGETWDLHLKGAGPTRYSRFGDGRAVLRSTIREYLASEAMFALGVPTTRALSIIVSHDRVVRERPEPAAMLIRMAPSHVRFGHFQVLASRGLTARIEELADHVLGAHHPDLLGAPDRLLRWLELVIERTAVMIAQWTAVGFAHGVMNTDNMSVLGLTLDYGPFGFMEEYQPNLICNHSDDDGRYAFDRQPAVGLWNLARFAEALLPLISVEDANRALEKYPAHFEAHYAKLVRAKLGLRTANDADQQLVAKLFDLLARERADYTNFFRTLADFEEQNPSGPASLRGLVQDAEALTAWLGWYAERLGAEGSVAGERRAAMQRVNPRYVLRNYLAQQAIEAAEQGDYRELDRLHEALKRPFDDQPGSEAYATPAPPWARSLVVSCSS